MRSSFFLKFFFEIVLDIQKSFYSHISFTQNPQMLTFFCICCIVFSYIYAYIIIISFFSLRVTSRHGAPLPLSTSVISTNKDSLLYHHRTMFKIRKWTLIEDLIKILSVDLIMSFGVAPPRLSLSIPLGKKGEGVVFLYRVHSVHYHTLHLVALSLSIPSTWNSFSFFSSSFVSLTFLKSAGHLFCTISLYLCLSEASLWLDTGYMFLAGIPQKWYCVLGVWYQEACDVDLSHYWW